MLCCLKLTILNIMKIVIVFKAFAFDSLCCFWISCHKLSRCIVWRYVQLAFSVVWLSVSKWSRLLINHTDILIGFIDCLLKWHIRRYHRWISHYGISRHLHWIVNHLAAILRHQVQMLTLLPLRWLLRLQSLLEHLYLIV